MTTLSATDDTTKGESIPAGLLDSARWARRLRELVEAHQVPGAALCVSRATGRGGRDLVTATAGVTNLATGSPVLPETVFQIGSVTKIWTTTLLMQLVDEGLLDLDQPIVEIVPGLVLPDSTSGTPITTRHLLTHQAGIDGAGIDSWDTDDGALARFGQQLAGATRLTEVDELWSYSNTGFSLAGRIVEVLRGTTWEKAVHTHIVEPLELGHVAISAEDAIVLSAAVGHLPGEGERLHPTPRWGIPRKDNPAGGIAASITDLAEFLLTHLRGGVGSNGVRILSEKSASAMQAVQVEATPARPMGELWGQGIGWHLSDWSGTAMFGHDGSTFGQYTHACVLPEHDLVIAVTIAGGDFLPFFHAVDDQIKDLLGIACAERTFPEQDPAVTIDPDVFGVYEREDACLRVFDRGGTTCVGVTKSGPFSELFGEVTEEQIIELTGISPHRFVYGDAEHLTNLEYLRTARGNEYLWMNVAFRKVQDRSTGLSA